MNFNLTQGMNRRDELGRGKACTKKFGDALLHPRTFSFNLNEECYLFFFLAFAFGFALAFAFFFAAILFSSLKRLEFAPAKN
jgi:hypothetical protein